jgi:hypothetical protein
MIINRHILAIVLSILFFINTFQAQRTTAIKTRTITPSIKTKETQFTRWSLRAGANLSVVYLARNTKEHNNEPGYSGGLGYEINNFLRLSTLYTHFKPVNIAPTWQNIKANTYEINVEIVAKFPNKKTLLYPFVGLSYNTFTGFFTGQQDYLNLHNFYPVNSIVNNNWLGVNLGTGLEHNFGIIGIYLDYRMRIGKEEKTFNIMDVCYTAGIKVRLPYGKYAKKYFGTNDRYNLQ